MTNSKRKDKAAIYARMRAAKERKRLSSPQSELDEELRWLHNMPLARANPAERVRFAESLGWTKCRVVAYHNGIIARKDTLAPSQNPFMVGRPPGRDMECELPDLPNP